MSKSFFLPVMDCPPEAIPTLKVTSQMTSSKIQIGRQEFARTDRVQG